MSNLNQKNGIWARFKEKHPTIAQFIVFFILSNGVTVLQMVMMPVLKGIFEQTSLVNTAFQVLPVGHNLDGSQYYVFNYAAGPVDASGLGGGLAYFLAVQITMAIAQVINFFLQRNVTFKSDGNVWKAAFWYVVAYICITLLAGALQGLYKAPIYAFLIGLWGGTGETIADFVTMIINCAISFWVFFPIFKVIFPSGEKSDSMVTIKEIAVAAGVSRGTVDRVLNNRPGVSPETSELVRKKARELGYHPDRTGQMLAARKKQLRLAFIVAYGEEFLFFRDVLEAAREKAASLEKVGVTVDFYLVEAFDRPSLEVLLQSVLDSRPDGIAALPLRTAPFIEFMEEVNRRKIPTVFFNLDEDFAEHLCYVGCDYYRSGQVAAGLCALCAGEEGEVGVLTHGKAVAPSYEARMAGFTRELAQRYPNMTLVNGGQPTVFNRGDDAGIAALLKACPNLKTLYIVNLGDFSVCRETRRMAGDRRLAIITNDLVPIQRELLRDGTISATVAQQPEIQGAQPLQILYEYLVFGIEPRNGICHTALEIILPQNCEL